MTAIDAMPAPAVACVRLLACPVCQYPRYVAASWPAGVCCGCVGDPTVLDRLEYIAADALNRANEAEATWTTTRAAASAEARAEMDALIQLRAQITDDASRTAFLDRWEQAQQIDGLPLLAQVWKQRTATVNACSSILDTTQPQLDALQSALKTLEQHNDNA